MASPAPSAASPTALGPMTLVLTASIATIGANSLALGPIAPAVAADLGTDVVGVMVASAGYGLGTAAGALGLSPLVDRLGARRALMAALAALVVVFGASAAAASTAWLVGAQTLAGLAAGLGLPATYAFAAAVAPPGHESRTLGRVLVGWTLSLVVGVSLSAVVADVGGWRWVYAGFALLTAAALVAVARVRVAAPKGTPAPDGSSVDVSDATAPTRPKRIVWPHSTLGVAGVVPLLVVCFGFMAAFYGVYAYVGAHVHDALGLPVRASALVTLAYGAGFGLAAFGDDLIDRLGARRALVPAFAAVVGVYVAMAAGAAAFAVVVGVAFAWGLANHFGLNLIVAGLSAVDPARRGAILGAYSATTYLAGAIGTLAFGRVFANHGFAATAATAAATVALAAALGIGAARRGEDRSTPGGMTGRPRAG